MNIRADSQRRRVRALIIFGALFAILIGHNMATAQMSYDFSPVTAQIQSWIDKRHYPGGSLIVVRSSDDRVLYEKYFGVYTPGTVAYEASAGKWLAAATIASVVDSGQLSWNDTAAKWIPQLNAEMGKATLRQLLSHTAGYPDYQPSGNPVDNYQTLDESVQHIIPLPANYEPGTHFQYGGEAMQVAGRMAELATGKDWETLFQQRIALPCEMSDTHFTPVDTVQGGHAPMLGGAAHGTAGDYRNFLDMIAHDGLFHGRKVLSESAVKAMQADQVRGAYVAPGKEFAERVRGVTYNGIYGLGEWREELDSRGEADLLSSPSWVGAYPWLDKRYGVYGIFFAHVDTSSTTVTHDRFSPFYSSPCLVSLVRGALDESRLSENN